MKAVIIDDEYFALTELTYLLKENDVCVIGSFTDPNEGYDFIVEEKPDVLFLDIDLPDINGIELALKVQTMLPHIAIVFVTAYSQYALDAYSAYPVDYILKPVRDERLKSTLLRIRQDISADKGQDNNELSIRAFGKFEIMCGDDSVRFYTKKSRELLAFLLCNFDKPMRRDEIVRILFEEEELQKGINNLYITLYRLRKALSAAGIQDEQLCIKEDYTLKIQDSICDFVDFSRFISNYGTIDKSNISKAESIIGTIRGDILNDMDDIWVAEVRTWILEQAEELLIRTALYYSTSNRWQKAEKLLIKLIDMIPDSQRGYQQLLNLYMRTCSLQKYDFYFRSYAKLMREDLDCLPEQRYVQYAQKIIDAG